MKGNKNQNTIKSVGKYTYGHDKNLTVLSWSGPNDKIYIGSFCSFGRSTTIIINADHNIHWISTFPFRSFRNKWKETSKIKGHPSSRGDVIIGSDVWIATGSTILSGVNIGDGAIISANATVTKDIEPYSVVGGVPAKHIKYRFDRDIREKLLEIKWWDWPDNKIRENVFLLSSNNIEEFIEKHKEL